MLSSKQYKLKLKTVPPGREGYICCCFFGSLPFKSFLYWWFGPVEYPYILPAYSTHFDGNFQVKEEDLSLNIWNLMSRYLLSQISGEGGDNS